MVPTLEETRFGEPPSGLLLQFLAWVAARPRTYAETMDAWRTSCPRLSVWEDACAQGLVQVEGAANGLAGAGVQLTAAGSGALAGGAQA
ncbi:MAG: hypothetical protein JOZ42_17070 [Acetobacteraceae bacterium]|nr:hypothetical protein [Acetobacteraceae bacterium]